MSELADNSSTESRITVAGRSRDLAQVDSVYVYGNRNIISVDEANLWRILKEGEESKLRFNDWKTPLGIGVSALITLATADFQDVGLRKIDLSPDTMEALFIIVALLSFIYCGVGIVNRVRFPSLGVQGQIDRLKAGSEEMSRNRTEGYPLVTSEETVANYLLKQWSTLRTSPRSARSEPPDE